MIRLYRFSKEENHPIRAVSNLSINKGMIDTHFQIQGSPTNLDDQAIGVHLDCVTELNPAGVWAGPGLSQAAPEDLARDLGLNHVLEESNFDVSWIVMH